MVDLIEPSDAIRSINISFTPSMTHFLLSSAGEYIREVCPVINDILTRSKVPVLVGGTTLWLDWFIHGVS